ncbi:MAG TPA: hypothetical protein VFM35_10625 [Candidatus Binatia bacterium]|nr:hypothetical protein [Candidatus Binatia bacterium]
MEYQVECISQLVSGRWRPKARVSWDEGVQRKYQGIEDADSELSFPTKEEADRYARKLADAWIQSRASKGKP